MNFLKSDLSTIVVRILFFALVLAFIGMMLYGAWLLTVPIGISMVLYFSLSPLIDYGERLGLRRWVVVCIVLPLAVAVVYGLYALAQPPIVEEYQTIQRDYDLYQARFQKTWGRFLFFLNDIIGNDQLRKLSQTVEATLRKIPGYLLDAVPSIITALIITPIMTFILLIQGNAIYNNLMRMVPNRYFEMTLLLVDKVREQIVSYLKGLMIQWAILSTILCLGLFFLDLPFAILIGLLAASLNIVPYLGPLIGIALGLLMASISNVPWPAVLAVFGVAQAVDNFFTQPVVLSRSVQIHPLISVLALIAAGQLLGPAGLIIAIPVAGIFLVSIRVMYKNLKAFRVI